MQHGFYGICIIICNMISMLQMHPGLWMSRLCPHPIWLALPNSDEPFSDSRQWKWSLCLQVEVGLRFREWRFGIRNASRVNLKPCDHRHVSLSSQRECRKQRTGCVCHVRLTGQQCIQGWEKTTCLGAHAWTAPRCPRSKQHLWFEGKSITFQGKRQCGNPTALTFSMHIFFLHIFCFVSSSLIKVIPPTSSCCKKRSTWTPMCVFNKDQVTFFSLTSLLIFSKGEANPHIHFAKSQAIFIYYK